MQIRIVNNIFDELHIIERDDTATNLATWNLST